jgi:type IV fimbrial biogenesis protein FimT
MRARLQAGFTATEIMIVVAIVGIVTAIAAPNMADMIKVQRVRAAAFDIVAALTLARSEALKRNQPVTITPNSGGWSNGWVTKDTAGNVLQQQGPFTCSSCSFSGPGSITYTSSGRLPLGTAAPQFAVTNANLDATKYRCINVDLSGRPVTTQGAC